MSPALVPELVVSDLAASLAFHVGLCGFRVAYDRPEEGFAFLTLGDAALMLEEVDAESWLAGPLERPFGRGINLEIVHPDLAGLAARLAAAGWPLFRGMEERWYRAGAVELGQRQFVALDPDGYMLRFCEDLGERTWGAP